MRMLIVDSEKAIWFRSPSLSSFHNKPWKILDLPSVSTQGNRAVLARAEKDLQTVLDLFGEAY